MRWRGGSESARLARALESGTTAGEDDGAIEALLLVTDRLSRVDARDRIDPQFRADMRRQLIGLAQQRSAELVPAPRSAARSSARPPVPAPIWGQRVAAVVAVLAVVLAIAGVLTIGARGALPGQTLYGVKRGAEQVQIAMTWDRDQRGFALLHLAETRLDEVSALVREPDALAGAIPGLPLAAGSGGNAAVVSTLAEMDRQTAAGVSLLTTSAVDRSDEVTLQILPTWAAGQRDQLDQLVAAMTAEERDRAEASLALLDRVHFRARMLGEDLPCACAGGSDELGPVPCPSCGSDPEGSSGTPPTPTPSGTAPSGTAPSGTVPGGTAPSGTVPSRSGSAPPLPSPTS